MHQLPDSMQRDPLDGNEAIDHVHKFFEKATDRLRSAGFTDEKIWLDPGIGFGKTDQGNIRLLKYTMLHAQNYQLVVGISRKSFIGRLLGVEDPVQRDQPSKMLELGLMLAGVKVIRTHNVKMLSQIRTLI
jgi:dihydropteroate synthase